MTPERRAQIRGILWRESLKYEPYGLPIPEHVLVGLELMREVDKE